MTKIIPGIVRVGYVSTIHLAPDIPLRGRAGIPVAILTDVTWIDTQGESLCQIDTEYASKGEDCTITLTFHTTTSLRVAHMAFVVQTANGQAWLIGAREAPYPTAQIRRSTGRGGERSGYDVKITFRSISSAVEVIL